MQVTVKTPEVPATGFVVNGEFYPSGEQDVTDEVAKVLKNAGVVEVGGLESVDGIGPELAEKLKTGGIGFVEQLNATSDADLLKIDGIGAATLKEIRKGLG